MKHIIDELYRLIFKNDSDRVNLRRSTAMKIDPAVPYREGWCDGYEAGLRAALLMLPQQKGQSSLDSFYGQLPQ